MSETPAERPTPEQPSDAWQKIARQLRAHREQQEREWAGVDEALLARCFLGQLSPQDEALLQSARDNPKVKLALSTLQTMRQAGADWLAGEGEEAAVVPSPQPANPVSQEGLPRPARKRRVSFAWLAAAACLCVNVGAAAFLGVRNGQLKYQVAAMAGRQAALEASARQLYSPWVYDRTTKDSYRFYLFRPSADDVTYQYHYVWFTRTRPGAFVYYYNPGTGKFWGRVDLAQKGEMGYSELPPGKRAGVLNDIPAENFPPPGPMPVIPGSKDGVRMLPPPRDLPPDDRAPDLPRVGRPR
jgi:hypothetical protein